MSNGRTLGFRTPLVGIGIGAVVVGMAYLQFSPLGHPALVLPISWGLVTTLVTAIVFPFHLARWLDPTNRLGSPKNLAAGLFLSLTLIGSVVLHHRVRMDGIEKIPKRAAPISDSIHAYQERFGRWPASLGSLVPYFFDEVPTTGVGAYPEYSYTAFDLEGESAERSWTLSVGTPKSFLNFDELIFDPVHSLDAATLGGSIERWGEWVYVHE